MAVGLWGVLQLLGIGAGLSALDPDDVRSAHGAALGTGAWSVIAPLIALFVGGWVAGKLANSYDRKVTGGHGLVVWGVTAAIGLVMSVFMVRGLALSARHHDTSTVSYGMENDTSVREAQEALVPINTRLKETNKAMISPHQLLESVRAAKTDDGFDNDKFVSALDENTALSKADAQAVAAQLGPRPAGLAERAATPDPETRDAIDAAKNTGKAVLGLSIAMLLGIAAAIGGALLSQHRFARKDKHHTHRHTTAQYPATTTTQTEFVPPAHYPPPTDQGL